MINFLVSCLTLLFVSCASELCTNEVTMTSDDDALALLQRSSVMLKRMPKPKLSQFAEPKILQTWPYPPMTPDIAKGYGVVGCIEDPFSSFEQAIAYMLGSMACVAVLCWMMTAPPVNAHAAISAPAPVVDVTTPLVQRPRTQPKMQALDGMRTVFTTYIIIYHWVTAGRRPLIMPESVTVLTQAAHLIVTMFFVLSGFVGYVAESGKQEHFSSQGTQAFIVRRLIRLCPAYFGALIWLACLASYDKWNKQPYIAWPVQALFGQTLLPLTFCGTAEFSESSFFLPFGANYVSWFISALVLVTLCFPLMFNMRPRSGMMGTAGTLVFVAILRSLPTVLEMNGFFPCPGVTLMNFGHCKSLYVFAPVRALEYYAGMLAAQLSNEMPQEARDWSGWSFVFDASLALAIVLATVFNWQGPPEKAGEYFNTVFFCFTCIACRMCALQAAKDDTVNPNPGVFGRLLSVRPLVSMAEYSYGAYIFSLAVLVSRPELPQSFFIVPIIGNWLVAVASLKFFENPINSLMQKRMQKNK